MADSDPGDGQEPTVGKLVRDNLLFLLGLAPVLMAMLRVALASQGDYGTVMTLVRTLDVAALIAGTFVRGIGLLLAAASLYVIVRVYWLRSGKAAGPELSRSLLPVLWVIFVIGVLAIYPEEVVDTDKWPTWDYWPGWMTVPPVDLVHSLAWVLAFCGLLWVLPRLWRIRWRSVPPRLQRAWWRRVVRGFWNVRWGNVRWGREALSVLRRRRRIRRRNASAPASPMTKGYLRTHVPELVIIAPVVLSLFWNNVASTERMWLPSEVITVTAASSLKSEWGLSKNLDFPAGDADQPVILWTGKKRKPDILVILAYVLASDGQSMTVTTPAGGIYLLPDGPNVTRQVCQDLTEPRPDQILDWPLLFWLPGQHRQPSTDQTQICKDAMLHQAHALQAA